MLVLISTQENKTRNTLFLFHSFAFKMPLASCGMKYHNAFYHLQSTFPHKIPIHPLSGIEIALLNVSVRTLRFRRVRTLVQNFTAHRWLNWTKLRHIPGSFNTHSGSLPHSREQSLTCPFFSFSFFLLGNLYLHLF